MTRVEATHEKISLLQEMQQMINTLSMEAERAALTEMESKIKSNGTDKKTRAPRGVK